MKLIHYEFPNFKQPAKGYRYNIDSFLLARFAQLKSKDLVCDLGAGVGILGFMALTRYKVRKVVAVEIQKELAEFAQENARLLGLKDHFEIFVKNWKGAPKFLKAKQFNVVISNPPYRKLKKRSASPSYLQGYCQT